ncbi:unnamed protein product [Ectocarpus sp. CCAP 1310/34]|nr:unnamed protein product [Ectocarpus sp. CCAP 1310/34]
MEAPSRQRRVESAAGGSTSRHRLHSNDSNDDDDIDGNRPAPVRPSTHRATKSTPRAAVEAARRLSVDPVDERAMGKVRLEVEALRDKLSEADLAKAHAQVADLKADLSLKEKQVAALRKSQAVEYTLKLAEEKEALQVRVEQLIAESNSKHDSDIGGRTTSFNSTSSSQKEQSAASNEASLTELERLRAQNLKMRKESARLRAELELVEMRGDSGSGRERGSRSRNRDSMDRGRARQHCHSDGARFYEGQAVECRKQGSDSWLPATVDSVRLKIEPLGGGGDGGDGGDGGGGDSRGSHRTYMYCVYFNGEETGRMDDVPEFRIRAAASGDGNGPGQGSSRVVRDRDGETVIRSRVFGVGDLVLVRDGGGGRTNQDNKKWTVGEVIRRNDNGTYRVLGSGGQAEGKDFHPIMLRAQDDPKNSFDSGCDIHDQPGASQTKTKANSPAEEAEIRYAERREELLELARDDLPAPLHVGQEVIAKSGGSTVWSSGVVVATDSDSLRCRVEFDSGDVEDSLPCIFVRPRSSGDLASGGDARTGDAVLAQKTRKQDTRTGDRGDWFAARFGSYDEDDADFCYVDFDGERASSRVQAARVRLVYPSARGGGGKRNDRRRDDDAMIPGNPPPPTKPVRAKKHREGDIVLACIPTVKKWTPAVITGVKGHGRYFVEWADFVREKPLLFMHIASMQGPSRKSAMSFGPKKNSDDSADSHHATTRATASGARGSRDGGDTGSDEKRSRVLPAESSAGGTTPSVRLRQRALSVGEPVLAKKAPDQAFWSPGCVTRADGGGRYDVRFTDGTTVEDLSFLFVRGLSAEQGSGDGGGGEVDIRSGKITSDTSEMHPSAGGRDPVVGDSVYVLKRGHSVEISSRDMHNRDLWRVATVTAVASGRYTVQYNGEEGKPKESRVVAERLRARNVIRQKAAQMGDAVLALSKTPGRGWVMGAVTARGSDGKYTISFADGTESDQIRFVNLRRVVGHAEGEEKDRHNGKPSARAIRQRRFKKGELALTKHSETRKWVIVKVLEALPSGRYDLQLLEEGSPNALGVPFQHIRHLDLACFAGDSQGTTGNGDGGGGGKRSPRDDMAVGERTPTRSHTMSDDGWDGSNGHDYHARSGHRSEDGSEGAYHQGLKVEKPREKRQASAGGGSTDYEEGDETSRNRREGNGDHGASSETRPLTIGSDVYVLRRGKRQDANLQDKTSWRSGTVVFVRSNGTFAVEYDEDGSPKEDRIAENRLRRRLNNNDKDGGDRNGSNNNSNDSNNDNGRSQDRAGNDEEYGDDFHHQDNEFEAGDMVFAQTGGWGRKNWTRVTVDAYLGKGLYRVDFADGSGTKELDSKKLSHADPSGTTRRSRSGKADPESAKSRWLDAGDPVVARRVASSNDDGAGGRKWETAKIVKVIDEEHYSILFSGDPEPVRVHFTEVKSLEDHAADNSRTVTSGLFLRVTEPSFDLKIAASAARHTSPRLILATGERAHEHDALWLHRKNIDSDDNDDDAWSDGSKGVQRNRNHNDGAKAVGFLSRGAARPGSRNPSWRDGEFWLSLKGLDDPALFVALEDGKNVQEQREGGRGGWKRGGDEGRVAFLAEACIPVPLEDLRGGSGGGGGGREGQRRNRTVEVELLDGAGVVTLQWSLHEDTSKMQ